MSEANEWEILSAEIRDAIKLHYDWPVDDIPSASVYGDDFTVDHSMICKLGATVLLLSVTAS